MKIETALLSVSDKAGILELAQALEGLGITVLSTGGTEEMLAQRGVRVMSVSEHTGFPEILDGRVKTLHPRIHGGILARLQDESHLEALRKHGIAAIGLVVVNLYPFDRTVQREGVSVEEAVEQIDVGGVTLIRAAAKNFASTTPVVDPEDYDKLVAELKVNNGEVREETRRWLARKAFHHTAAYDAAVAAYFDRLEEEEETVVLPPALNLGLVRVASLRYGENPHQRAALYRPRFRKVTGLAAATQHHGKELSYNNYLDLDAAWELCGEFEDPFCVIVKHTNPCGAAVGASPLDAYRKAFECDPLSAFGSIVGFNRVPDLATAEEMRELFVEAVIAPGFEEEALEVFKQKKNLRIIEMPGDNDQAGTVLHQIAGGLLVQDRNGRRIRAADLRVATARAPGESETADLLFAWRVCKHVKSNAIVLARRGRTLGIGAGQMSRVDAVELAARKAVLALADCVLASDAFFPFRDGIDRAHQAGAAAVIQPGGSVRDKEVIAAADEYGMAMVLTGMRHFRH